MDSQELTAGTATLLMSADPNNIKQSFTRRLDDFDRKIRENGDNAALLEEINAAVSKLLAESGDDEFVIREILQRRYNAGKLRLETYQLVRNVLDRIMIESMATMPDAVDREDTGDPAGDAGAAGADEGDDVAPEDRLQVGSVLRERFMLQERIAGGSMGVVYKALDRRLAEADGFDPWVAVKVLSPKLSRNGHALRALQQEAAKGRTLSHPNIVRFIDLDREGEIYFIVMEWLEGRSLATILDENRNRPMDLTMSLDIVRQVGYALDYAHRSGVIHADVKPANIMITPSGQVKLFDFGIARLHQKESENNRDFDPGVLGAITPAYSSVQVLSGHAPTAADDVFSLGCLMYRLVAGHRVFGPRNAAEAADEGLQPERPRGLSDAQWAALKKALAYSYEDRYATPAEFLRALDSEEPQGASVRVLDEPIIVDRVTRPQEGRRPPWGLIAVGAGAAVAAAVVVWLNPGLLGGLSGSADMADNSAGVAGQAEQVSETQDAAMPADPSAEGETPVTEVEPPAGDVPEATADDAMPPMDAGTDVDPASGPVPGDEVAADAGTDPATSGSGSRLDDWMQRQQAAAEAGQGGPIAAEEAEPAAEIPDYSSLPPPTATVPLAGPGQIRPEVELTLREDTEAAVIELVRESGVGEPLAVRLEEVGFSGNQSPWEGGRYRLSEDGIARFAAGQERARLTISVPSNTQREPDRQATLLFRDVEDPSSALAIVNLSVEDDDQRAFESTLPENTVGFFASRINVRESDPAVQIDVLRFNPGNGELEVRYSIGEGTAVEGEDYFVPGATGLVFGPRQRSARLLIPLVQDALVESDETFTLELSASDPETQANIYRSITVVVRDDDAR